MPEIFLEVFSTEYDQLEGVQGELYGALLSHLQKVLITRGVSWLHSAPWKKMILSEGPHDTKCLHSTPWTKEWLIEPLMDNYQSELKWTFPPTPYLKPMFYMYYCNKINFSHLSISWRLNNIHSMKSWLNYLLMYWSLLAMCLASALRRLVLKEFCRMNWFPRIVSRITSQSEYRPVCREPYFKVLIEKVMQKRRKKVNQIV